MDGDPTTDIRATRSISAVIRGGQSLDRDAIRQALAADRDRAAGTAEAIAAGAVSDFDDGTTAATFGAGWTAISDRIMGGKSHVDIAVVEGGAEGTSHALSITGEVVAGAAMPWAGASFLPGPDMQTPANLSGKTGIAFRARGDGKAYVVILFSTANHSNTTSATFTTGEAWTHHELPFTDFASFDPAEALSVFIGSTTAGAFSLAIDDVRFY